MELPETLDDLGEDLRALAGIGCAILVGCGPLTRPMVERLDLEQQAQVGSAWQNMLSPPDRLNRELLLDVLIVFQAHQRGVDRLLLTSEKDVPGGKVVMTISFDRSQPEGDRFTVVYCDPYGYEWRRELYKSEEVQARWEALFGPLPCEEVVGEDGQIRLESSKAAEAERAARFEDIRAATQPAEEPPPGR